MGARLKVNDLLNLNHVFKLIIDDTQAKIDALFKFKLLGLMKAIEPQVTNFEIIRNEKIIEYGEQTEDGSYKISPDTEAFEKFNIEMKNIIDSEVTVNIEKLKAAEIFDKGVTAEYLIGLYPIIEQWYGGMNDYII